MRDALGAVLRQCDLFLPSGPEPALLTAAGSEKGAIAEVPGLGVSAVVVKRGGDGASFHDGGGALHMAAFPAQEIDPTGAGDCFGATFVTCRLQGRGVEDSLRHANAGGARTAGVRGPMEGTSSSAELDALIAGAEGA